MLMRSDSFRRSLRTPGTIIEQLNPDLKEHCGGLLCVFVMGVCVFSICSSLFTTAKERRERHNFKSEKQRHTGSIFLGTNDDAE